MADRPLRRDLVLAELRRRGRPCRLAELAAACGLRPQDVWQHLHALRNDGAVISPSRGVYALTPASASMEASSVEQLAGAAPFDEPSDALGDGETSPEAIAALRREVPRLTVLQTSLTNLLRMTSGVERFYLPRLPQTIAVELTLARTHLEEALQRAAAWEGK